MNEIAISASDGTHYTLTLHDPSPIASEPDVWRVRAETAQGEPQEEYFEAATDLEVLDIINLAIETLKNS